MPRKAKALANMDPKEARDLIMRHFRRINSTGGINRAEFAAQKVEEDMVEMLIGWARNPTLAEAERFVYVNKILEIARGKIAPWVHAGQTIDPTAIGETGMTVSAEMQLARDMAEVDAKIADLMMRRIPPDDWPEEVRLRAGNLIETLQAEDVKLEGPVIEGQAPTPTLG